MQVRRCHLVEPEEASREVREIYDDYRRSTGEATVPNWLKSLGSTPWLARAYWARVKGTLLAGELPDMLKELIIFAVSVENGSRYCAACHAHALISLDPTLTYEKLVGLLDTMSTVPDMLPSHQVALNFAILAARNVNEISDEQFAALSETGFSRSEIHELISVIDLAIMFNSYARTMEIPIDPGYKSVLSPADPVSEDDCAAEALPTTQFLDHVPPAMQRYTLVEYDSAPPEVRSIYEDYLRSTGVAEVPIWLQSLGSDPVLLEAYWERTKGTLLNGNVPMVLKELIIFVVSVENGSRYCSACHAHAVLSLDKTLKFEDLDALLEADEQLGRLPPSHRAAVRFATAAARHPNHVTDADFRALVDADFSDEDIAEIMSAVDLAMMFNCYTGVLQLPLDPDYRPVLAPLR